MNRVDIYRVIDKFSKEQWRDFSRLKLDLDEQKMDELEDRWRDDFKQQKFKTVIAWEDQTDRKGDSLQLLMSWKREFFCGEQEDKTKTKAEQAIQSAADVYNLPTPRYIRYSESYKLTAKKGLVLIISNSFTSFAEKGHRTPACHKDVESMEKLWRDTIGCTLLEGRSHQDKSAAEMRDLLRKLGKSPGYDYMVVVISTHGEMIPEENKIGNQTFVSYQEVLLGNDNKHIRAKEIQSLFDNDAARNLQGIPKLFILQYCRGKEVNRGVKRESEVSGDAGPHELDDMPLIPIDSLMPTTSDVLTAYPTHENQKAFKNDDGSWFIQTIFKVFKDGYRQKHVTDMLTDVNLEMMNKRGEIDLNDCKSMSIYESSLTKRFYLVDPQTPPSTA
uniref:caspase-2-like n=1 Tax=Styela clava TaxID=7725 RepID=UPI0019397051|nr:caspase-2-like [Styela clava]